MRLDDHTPAHRALSQVPAARTGPRFGPGWRRRPGRPRHSWIQQIGDGTPFSIRAEWSKARLRGQSGLTQRTSAVYAIWWWWWRRWWWWYGRNFRGASAGMSDQCSVKAWLDKKVLGLNVNDENRLWQRLQTDGVTNRKACVILRQEVCWLLYKTPRHSMSLWRPLVTLSSRVMYAAIPLTSLSSFHYIWSCHVYVITHITSNTAYRWGCRT